MKVTWTPTASRDMRSIYDFIHSENPSAAARIIDKIFYSATQLSKFPESGRPGRVPATRELPVSGTPFVVAYDVAGASVRILAVIHGARAWPDFLDER